MIETRFYPREVVMDIDNMRSFKYRVTFSRNANGYVLKTRLLYLNNLNGTDDAFCFEQLSIQGCLHVFIFFSHNNHTEISLHFRALGMSLV